MNWIRVQRKIRTSKTIQDIAEACRVRRNEAQGAVVSLLCALPDHATDGSIAGLSDAVLEQWAQWEGKRGRFAAAFRAHMCEGDRVTMWDEYNGSAIREAERNRKNVAAYRDRKRRGDDDDSGPSPATASGCKPAVSGDRTAYILVNGTERNETATTSLHLEKRCSTTRDLADVLPDVTARVRARQRRGIA